MFSFLRSKSASQPRLPFTDIHSHLLPGLDDGTKTSEESIELIRQFAEMGYTRLVTTPHVMSDFYRNDSVTIRDRLAEVQLAIARESIPIQIDAAAEYYLDEELFRKINQNEKLLTFGDNYLLFETNFLTEPFQLKEFIFASTTQGYKLVLAHPERYQYLIGHMDKIEDLRNRGVLLQLNLPSLIGAYSKPIQKFANQLIDKGWVDFIGTDCHNQFQFDLIKEVRNLKYFKKVMELPLLNDTISRL